MSNNLTQTKSFVKPSTEEDLPQDLEVGQAALYYHSLGWSLLPIAPASKKPHSCVGDWKQYQRQRPTEAQLRQWWAEHPDTGIAVVLGKVSGGLVALDLDREGAPQLARDHKLPLPPTATSRTGGGGLHYLFHSEDRLTTTTTLLKGNDCHIELRAEGSYIVLPPSIHPSGQQYEWLIPPSEGIEELPDAIRQRATTPEEREAASLVFPTDKLPDRFEKLLAGDDKIKELWEEKAPDGDQSARDYALVCRCLEKGLTEEETATALWLMPFGKRRRDGRGAQNYVLPTVQRAAKEVPDQAPQETPPGEGKDEEKVPASEYLIRIARAQVEQFFTDETKTAFVQVPVDQHFEVWPLKSRQFTHWVAGQYHKVRGKAPYTQALADALLILWGDCEKGPTLKLHNRVAWHQNALWYDLADEDWRAVRIESGHWEIVEKPPILFRRYVHQQPQVEPVKGGRVADILPFLNLPDDEDLKLLVQVYLVSCFLPDIPHPILNLAGPQGSAKSSFSRVLRKVGDPSATGTLSFPRDQNTLVQQLQHNWMAYFDNVTTLPAWLSDILCRASTGEGFGKRQLYTDDEDIIYTYKRVAGINGIVNAASRPDFLDRCIIVNLERLPDDRRQTEEDLQAALSLKLPAILGGCFGALAYAIELYPAMILPALPRMADFAKWGACIGEGLGFTQQQFLNAYGKNIAALNELAIEAQPFAQAIIALIDSSPGGWQGTASQLLEAANRIAGEQEISTETKAWPASPVWATRRLKEAKVNLQQAGISVSYPIERGKRLIALKRV